MQKEWKKKKHSSKQLVIKENQNIRPEDPISNLENRKEETKIINEENFLELEDAHLQFDRTQ